MSNTYSRTLLDSVSPEDAFACLQDATSLVDSLQGSLSRTVIDAIIARISLRDSFLRATIASEDTADHNGMRQAWIKANEALSQFKKLLSVPTKKVTESFSAKIQQKLASTMPPRPIVELNIDEAIGHLTKLLEDSLKAIEITDYSDPHSLLVGYLEIPH